MNNLISAVILIGVIILVCALTLIRGKAWNSFIEEQISKDKSDDGCS